MSARCPLARTRPVVTAVDQSSRPAARSSQVSGSVSTTFGGVPRVCRGPGTHWMAANGGTRTSTVRPGTRSSSRCRLYRTAARSAGRSGGEPAASASVTAARLAAPRARSVATPGQGGWPSAARCSLTAASILAGSGPRGGTAKQASGDIRQRAAPTAARNSSWNFIPSGSIEDLIGVFVRYARSAQISAQAGAGFLAAQARWPDCGDSSGRCRGDRLLDRVPPSHAALRSAAAHQGAELPDGGAGDHGHAAGGQQSAASTALPGRCAGVQPCRAGAANRGRAPVDRRPDGRRHLHLHLSAYWAVPQRDRQRRPAEAGPAALRPQCRSALAPYPPRSADPVARLLPVRERGRRGLPDAGWRASRADLRCESQGVRGPAASQPAPGVLVVVGLDQPNSAGRTPRCTSRSSSSGTANKPLTSSAEPPVSPSASAGTPACAHMAASAGSAPRLTATTARAADSLKRNVAGSAGSVTMQPVPPARHDSASATARPPSETSWAQTSSSRAAAVTRTSASARSASRSTAGGRPPRWPCRSQAHSEPPNSALVAPRRTIDAPGLPNPDPSRRRTSSWTPSTPTTGVGWMGALPVWL